MRVFPLLCAALFVSLPFTASAAELFVTPKVQEAQEETLRGMPPSDVPTKEAQAEQAPAAKPKKQIFVDPTSKNPQLSAVEIDRIVIMHTQEIGAYCVGSWQSQPCMKALSSSNLTLASMYAESLAKGGHQKVQDALLQNCAASTAATKTEVPAYAMKSAMTTCANVIYDITEATKVRPNLTHFQLLVEPIFCLGGEARCADFEKILREVVAKSMPQQQQQAQ